ncbi:ATP-binding protein [Nocardia sp. NPDC055321]
MAIPAVSPVTVIDTNYAEAEVATMTSLVDEDGARRIMGMLVDMYSNPETAVAREYIANAVDATIAAGSRFPVEVSTPDALTPTLVVTDRGTGMTMAEVEAVYLAFAASTKRDTNTQVGGLGVGAKSAWTVTDSFVIDTVKDGRRTVVRAARDLEHQVLVADVVTDQPSGTTITIPVSADKLSQWGPIVESVAAAHRPETVVVDGRPVASMQGGPRWVGPIRCGGVDGGRTVTVLSGGTLFAIPTDLAATILKRVDMGCVLELPIGSFDHTPSRESLIATARTEAAVEHALAEFTRAWAVLGDRIAALAATDVQAAQQLRAATLDGDGNPSHLPIHQHMSLKDDVSVYFRAPDTARTAWNRGTLAESVPMRAFGRWCTTVLVVHGVPENRTLRGVAKYIKYFAANTTTIVTLRGTAEAVELPVAGHDQSITIGVRTTGVAVVSYADMHTRLQSLRAKHSAAQSDPAFTVSVKQNGAISTQVMTLSRIAALTTTVLYAASGPGTVPESLADGVLVSLNRKSPARFTAEVPHAIDVTDWNERHSIRITESVTELDLDAVALRNSDHQNLFTLASALSEHVPADHPGGRILHRMTEIHRHHTKPDRPGHALRPLWRAMHLHKTPEFIAAETRIGALAQEIESTYPLVRAVLATRGAHARKHEIVHLGHYIASVPAIAAATSVCAAA